MKYKFLLSMVGVFAFICNSRAEDPQKYNPPSDDLKKIHDGQVNAHSEYLKAIGDDYKRMLVSGDLGPRSFSDASILLENLKGGCDFTDPKLLKIYTKLDKFLESKSKDQVQREIDMNSKLGFPNSINKPPKRGH